MSLYGLNQIITLGTGITGDIPHFLLLGLSCLPTKPNGGDAGTMAPMPETAFEALPSQDFKPLPSTWELKL